MSADEDDFDWEMIRRRFKPRVVYTPPPRQRAARKAKQLQRRRDAKQNARDNGKR